MGGGVVAPSGSICPGSLSRGLVGGASGRWVWDWSEEPLLET
jgi:hypothetical protein